MAEVPPVLHYDAPFPLYGVSLSKASSHPTRTAVTSFLNTSSNKLQVVDVRSEPEHYGEAEGTRSAWAAEGRDGSTENGADFQVLATASHAFPPTKIDWEPVPGKAGGTVSSHHGAAPAELLATTGDVLRIWALEETDEEQGGGSGFVGGRRRTGWRLRERSKLSNSKSPAATLPPLTSFSWNPSAPQSIVTASVDTTATIWDISTGAAVTQLIAHDSAVNDISWLPQSQDVFVSVGFDGSLRAFDLRSLEHSTILYESPGSRPLARIGFSPVAQHYLATFGLDDGAAIVLDMRSPGAPVAEVRGHGAGSSLSGIGWGMGSRAGSGGGGGWLATCGDDSQLLLYDLTSPLPYPSSTPTPSLHSKSGSARPTPSPNPDPGKTSGSRAPTLYPSYAWNAPGEVSGLAWGAEERDGCWIGCVGGRRLSLLRV